MLSSPHAPADVQRKWLLLQLRPTDILGKDVFEDLYWHCCSIAEDTVDTQIASIIRGHGSVLGLVAVDDAQVCMSLHHRAFLSSNRLSLWPLLDELVSSLLSYFPETRLILSGIRADFSIVHDAIVAAESPRGLRHFHALGTFQQDDATTSYLRHFLSDSLEPSQYSYVCSWLHGRHRPLNLFIMYCLMVGAHRWREVLNTILCKTTDYVPPDQEELDAVHLHWTVITNKRLDGCGFAGRLREVVLRVAAEPQPIVLSTHVVESVALGIALFASKGRASEIFEPLILLTLVRWLRETNNYTISALVRRHLAAPSKGLAESGLYPGIAAIVWDVLQRDSSSLSSLVHFAGREPDWAQLPASVVLQSCQQNRIEAFSQPFLIPDPGLGADMLCGVAAGDVNILLFFHTAHTTLASLRFKNRVVLPDPADFYAGDSRAQETLHEIFASLPAAHYPTTSGRRLQRAKYSILRVLCFAELQDPSRAHNPAVAYFRPDVACGYRGAEISFDVVLDEIEE